MQVQHELRRSVAFRFVVFAAPTVQCVSAQHRGGGSARLPHFCCNVSPLGSHARCGRGAATSWPLDAHAPFAGPRDAPVLPLDRAMRRSVSDARHWVSRRSSVAVLLMDDAMGSRVHSRALDPARRRSALTRSQTHFLPSCRIDLRAPLSRERLSRLALSHKRVLGSTPATRVQIAQKMPHDVVLPARYRRAYHFAGGCIIEGFPRSRCSYNIAHAFDTCV